MSAVNMSTMQIEEGILKDARRSRFSFHFNTLRRRRWVLVQLVSVPVDGEHVQADTALQKAAETQAATHYCPLSKLVDDFRNNQMMKRWV
jgi:hypothetical protein